MPSCKIWYCWYPFVRREMRWCQWGQRGQGKRWTLSFGGKRGTGWDLSYGDNLVILSIVSVVIYSIIICIMYFLYVPI